MDDFKSERFFGNGDFGSGSEFSEIKSAIQKRGEAGYFPFKIISFHWNRNFHKM